MTEEAKALRRAYKRRWNKANKDKVKAATERYWERRTEYALDAKEIINAELKTNEPTE